MTEDENHNFVPDDLSNYKVVRQGDLVINKMKAWQGSLGVAPCNGVVSPAYFVFSLDIENRQYAQALLRSRVYVPFFAQASDGVRIGQWDLSIEHMKRIPVFLPSPEEQAAIVRFVHFVDYSTKRLIRTKRRVIELLSEKKLISIVEAIRSGIANHEVRKSSGLDWLPVVPASWKTMALRLRYSVELGKMLDAKRITGAFALPYLRNMDVQWDRINTEDLPVMDIPPSEYDRYTVRSGDLLVCEGGEVGRAAFWKGQLDCCGYQKALHRVRCLNSDEDWPRFLYYLLFAAAKLGVFAADGSENTIAHLTAEKLRAHRFAFPPYGEQVAIAESLDSSISALDQRIGQVRREIELISEYRTRLIADVVTGKFDVREVQLPQLEGLEEVESIFETNNEEAEIEGQLVGSEEGDDAAD
jgi:type I restriction enzyme S subunit